LPGTDPQADGTVIARMEERLLSWYGHHGRDLPWRNTRDPYAILVSEVMLQQTEEPRFSGSAGVPTRLEMP
jgi:A/G-specific adenine glycosylase